MILSRYSRWLYPVLLVLITVPVFSPVLNASFLNWDDLHTVYENPHVLTLSFANIAAMFKTTVIGTYIPLTTLSFSFEKALFGLEPFWFHLNNLLLHLAVAVLLMRLFRRLGASDRSAFLGAVLFAIHPMHVESVAWVTERKDVLYSLFYVLALRQWWKYLGKRDGIGFGLTLLWALLSVLSKPMAISLPLLMLFLEWWREGSFHRVRWAIYVPFLVIAGGVGMVTYLEFARNPLGSTVLSALLLWCWTFAFYFYQFFLPVILHPLYSAPSVTEYPFVYWGAVLFVAALAFLIFRAVKAGSNRWLVLAAGWFFISIFFLLKFDNGDIHLVADRYMYLASAGLCVCLGVILDGMIHRYGRMVWALIVVVAVMLGTRTLTYTKVWSDSITLWSYIIKLHPRLELAYNNRAVAYGEAGQFALAAKDLTDVMDFTLNPALAHINRGLVYSDWAESEAKAGHKREELELVRRGVDDFTRAIEDEPDFARSRFQRARLYLKLEEWALAVSDLTQAVNRGYVTATVYNDRAVALYRCGKDREALEDIERALALDPAMKEANFNRRMMSPGN